jgi:transposase-like protein
VNKNSSLSEAPLGKNGVSRLVGRLAAPVEAWKDRSLANEAHPHLYLDATNLKFRVVSLMLWKSAFLSEARA